MWKILREVVKLLLIGVLATMITTLILIGILWAVGAGQ
jgi:nitrogen fixation-related uncharacterized protein